MPRSSSLAVTMFTMFAISAAACADSTEDGATGTGAAVTASSASAHAAAIEACDATHDAASPITTNDHVQVANAFRDCLRAANDGALAAVEQRLAESGSTSKGHANDALSSARTQTEALCTEQGLALGSSFRTVVAANCPAEGERFLARLVDAFVDFGAAKEAIAEERLDHPQCYASAQGQDHTRAQVTVDTCERAEIDAVAAHLAEVEIATDPKNGDLPVATARVKARTGAVLDANGKLCLVLADASKDASAAGTCNARVTEWVYAQLHALVIEN